MRKPLVIVLVAIIALSLVEASSRDEILVRPKRTLHLLQAMLNAFAPSPANIPALGPLPKAQPKVDRLPPPQLPVATKAPPPPSPPASVPSSFFSNFPSFGFAKFNFFVTPFNTFPPVPEQPTASPAPPTPSAAPAPTTPPAPQDPPIAPASKAPGPSKFTIPIPRTMPTAPPTSPPAPTEPQSTLPPPTDTTLIPEADPKINSSSLEDDDANASSGDTTDNPLAPNQLWRSSLFDAAEGPAAEAAARFTGNGFFGDSSNQFLRFGDNTENFYNPSELQFRRSAEPNYRHWPKTQEQPQQSASYYHQAQASDFGRAGAAQSSVKMHDNNFNYVTYHNGPAMTVSKHLHGAQTQYFGKRSVIY